MTDLPIPDVGSVGTVDSMGSRCPQPIIDIARYMRDKPIGTEAILLSDDPATAPDISAWARMTKNFSQEIARHRFLIRKESDS